MVRVRHYTRISSMRKILAEGVIRARDQNKVFVEKANSRLLAPRDAEDLYDLLEGKGNAYLEFDVRDDELGWKYNKRMRIFEYFLVGDVDLQGRSVIGK